MSWTGPVILGATSTIECGFDLRINGDISGPGGLIKTGSNWWSGGGTLTLNGINNTFAGGVTLKDGATVAIINNKSLGTGTLQTGNALGGTLNVQAEMSLANPINLASGGNLTVTGSNAVLSGPISGDGTLTKAGGAALTLTNNSNSFGGLSVNDGSLTVSGSGMTVGALSVRNTATVTVGPEMTTGLASFANGGTVDATTNPLTVTNTAYFAGVSVYSDTPFILSGSDVVNPTYENHRKITAQGGTMTITTPQPGTSGAIDGTFASDASYDSETGVWTVTGNPGQSGQTSDRSAWCYTEIPAGDFDYTVHVTGGLGDWRRGGLMVRDALTGGQSSTTNMAAVWATGGQVCNLTRVDGTALYSESGGGGSYTRLTRTGATVTGSYSSDGSVYTPYFSKTYTTWGDKTYIGLNIWYGSDMSVTFDNVSFLGTGVMPDWSTTDIVTTANTALVLPAPTTLGNLSLKGGSLSADKDITMAADFIYNWEFSGGAGDSLAIDGSLTLAGAWTLQLAGGSTPAPGVQYDLFTYTGDFSGTGFVVPTIDDSEVSWPAIPTIYLDDDTLGAGRIYMMFGLLGDANGDDVVDAADFITLKRNFGTGTEWSEGDFDNSDTVDWNDLSTLMGNMGSGTGGTAVVTPEPATLFVMMAAGLPALLKRRRRVRS